MRTSEVFALTWDDIDLENRTIKVTKTVYSKLKDENGRWYLGTTKLDISLHVFIKISSTFESKITLLYFAGQT